MECLIILSLWPKFSFDSYMNTSLAAKGALAHRLQRSLQNQKWPPGGPKISEGVWKGVYGVLSYFRYISFLIWVLLLWEKVVTEENGENTRGGSRR